MNVISIEAAAAILGIILTSLGGVTTWLFRRLNAQDEKIIDIANHCIDSSELQRMEERLGRSINNHADAVQETLQVHDKKLDKVNERIMDIYKDKK